MMAVEGISDLADKALVRPHVGVMMRGRQISRQSEPSTRLVRLGCAWLRDANEGCEGTMVTSNGIDYAAEAELFDYATEAELFSRNGWRKSRRPPLGYKRFARASDAIRFAIEELPPQLLVSTILEVAEKRYQSTEIRFLYESEDYPLARRL